MTERADDTIEAWLRGRLKQEALQNSVEGASLVFLGFLVQALVSYGVAFVTIMVLFRVMAVLSLLNRETDLIRPAIIWSAVLLFFVLSVQGALRYRYSLDYSQTKVSLRSSVASGEVMKAIVMLISEILFAGPRLLITGSESLMQAIHQWRVNPQKLATIIDWLALHGPKASIPELTSRFGEDALALRHVPGIIWLAEQGVAILSEEIRNKTLKVLSGERAFRRSDRA